MCVCVSVFCQRFFIPCRRTKFTIIMILLFSDKVFSLILKITLSQVVILPLDSTSQLFVLRRISGFFTCDIYYNEKN